MRVYNEKEIQALLRQAAALQAARRDFTTGLTLEEIRRVAEDAGIDPHFVEQAALGAPLPRREQKGGFWGGAYKLEAERVVGHEVDAEEWGEMVHEIRRAFGTTGDVREVGRGFEWLYGYPQYGSSYIYGHVSVTPRRGRTRLHATRKLSNQSTVFLIPFFLLFPAIGLGILAGVGKVSVFLPILLVLATALSFWGARAWFGNLSRDAQQQLDEMMTRLEQIAGESETYEAGQEGTIPEGRLDPNLLDEAPAESEPAARSRRRVR